MNALITLTRSDRQKSPCLINVATITYVEAGRNNKGTKIWLGDKAIDVEETQEDIARLARNQIAEVARHAMLTVLADLSSSIASLAPRKQ